MAEDDETAAVLLEVVAAAPDRVGRAESAYETEAALAADGVTLIAVPAELVTKCVTWSLSGGVLDKPQK